MFADPQSVTYATVAKSLPAISRGEAQSEYKLVDGTTATYSLILSHQFKTRNRVVARLKRDVYAADALVPANFVLASATCTFTMDFPSVGVSLTGAQDLAKALVAFLSDANILKLAGGET